MLCLQNMRVDFEDSVNRIQGPNSHYPLQAAALLCNTFCKHCIPWIHLWFNGRLTSIVPQSNTVIHVGFGALICPSSPSQWGAIIDVSPLTGVMWRLRLDPVLLCLTDGQIDDFAHGRVNQILGQNCHDQSDPRVLLELLAMCWYRQLLLLQITLDKSH